MEACSWHVGRSGSQHTRSQHTLVLVTAVAVLWPSTSLLESVLYFSLYCITRGGRKVRLIDLPILIRSSGYNRLMSSSEFCIGRLCRFVLSSDSLIDRSCFLVFSSDFCIWRLCRSVLSSDSLINRSCFLVLSSDFCIVRLCQPVLSKKSLYQYFIKIKNSSSRKNLTNLRPNFGRFCIKRAEFLLFFSLKVGSNPSNIEHFNTHRDR